MSTATLTSKGQITLPAIVRATLSVEAGDTATQRCIMATWNLF